MGVTTVSGYARKTIAASDWPPARPTWRRRLEARMKRPANRASCYARIAYGEALATDAERFAMGSPAWLRLEAWAAIGWPLNAVRFWRDVFALYTAHPGDVWADLERDVLGVVWKVDARGTWLIAQTYERRARGLEPEVLLVPRYRYLAWSSRRRGWLT